MRPCKYAVVVFGISLGTGAVVFGQEAGPGLSAFPNPALAQNIAQALKENGKLSRYRVNVIAHGGLVDLVGEVTDESQREIVIKIARSAKGVVLVRDFLQTPTDPAVMPAQALPMPPPMPMPLPQPQLFDKGAPFPPRIDGELPPPMPIFQPMPGPNPTMQPPPMPPYAWPAYAPYNNYSRVATPNAYPYEQWPFIGPMYPFPRVPLGWRSVSLTWEDGNWWFHRNPTGHDWWRVRYW